MTRKGDAPTTVEALDTEVLCARRSVILAKRRLRRRAKPLYVNCDATWRRGVAGLAYASDSLGKRSVVVACTDVIEAEYQALLMAMMDAENSELPGPIEFRIDATVVADLERATSPRLAELRRQIVDRLARHPEWRLELVSRRQNWIAEASARRALSHWYCNELDFGQWS